MSRVLPPSVLFCLAALISSRAEEPNAETVNLDPPVATIPDAFAPLDRFKNKSAVEWLAELKTRDDPARLKGTLEALAELIPLQNAPTLVDDLLATLKEATDVDTMRLAILALGKIGPDAKSAETPLLNILISAREAPPVRAAACRALIEIAPASTPVRNAIIAATSDVQAELRHEAFDALIVLAMPANSSDVPAKQNMPTTPFGKPNSARSKLAPPPVPPIIPGTFPYPPALDVLAKAALNSRDAKDADAALRTLGDAGVDPLVRALQGGTPLARAVAAETLGSMNRSAQRALPALLQAARKESDKRVREASICAAVTLNSRDPAVLDALVEGLGMKPDPSLPVRSKTVEDLFLEAGKDALPALRKALRSESTATRFDALRVLARLVVPEVHETTSSQNGAERILPSLPVQPGDCLQDFAARLRDKDDGIRLLAVQTLNRIGPPALGALGALQKAATEIDAGFESNAKNFAAAEFRHLAAIAALNVSRDPAAPNVLTPLDSLSVEQLIALLNGVSPVERADAALSLRLHPSDATAAESLLKALEYAEPKVRRSAARALGAFGPLAAPAAPTLIAWLGTEPRSRMSAIETLADLGIHAPNAANALTKTAAEDVWPDEPEFERTLVRALRPHAPVAVPALIGYVRSGSPAIRARSARALGLLGPTAAEALPDLLELAQSSDDAEARAAYDALRWIGPEKDPNGIPFLSSVIRGSLFATRRQWAVAALGLSRPALDAGVPERTGALASALFDSDDRVCSAACDALIQIGDSALPLLVDAVSSERGAQSFWPLMALSRMPAEPALVVPRLFAYSLPGSPTGKRVLAARALGHYARTCPGAMAALLRMLRSRDSESAHAAMRALLPAAQDVRGTIEKLLFDRDPAIRKIGAETLDLFH